MSTDPILDEISNIFFRALYFPFVSTVLASAIWTYALMVVLHVKATDLVYWLFAAFAPISYPPAVIYFWMAVAIGILSTTIIFMMLGRWWKKRSELPRRGAKLTGRH